MAKKFSASDMLSRSQVRQPRPDTDQVTSSPVDKSTDHPVDQSPSVTRYQKTAVFFAPHQRAWLRQVTRELPEGLSASDVVRLAVERLLADVEGGLDLHPTLVAQARDEAERYAGRRNSGVNQL